MLLDTTMNLQCVMAASATAAQPEIQIVYVDWTPDPQRNAIPFLARKALNHITDVTVLAAPTGIAQAREVTHFSCYNKDSVTQTVTVKSDDGSAEYIFVKQALGTGKTLCWDKGAGWQLV